MDISQLAACTATEVALSADNVAVWAAIMRGADLPAKARKRVLAIGIAAAFVIRVAAIVAGANALARFGWLVPVLGGVLVWSGWKMLTGDNGDDDGPARFGLPIRVSVAVRTALALSVTDVVFAVDSIPASFGITGDPVVIAVANGVALVALVVGFVPMARAIERLRFLPYALGGVLVWLGAGMMVRPIVAVPEHVSLAVVAVLIAGGVAGSMVWEGRVRA